MGGRSRETMYLRGRFVLRLLRGYFPLDDLVNCGTFTGARVMQSRTWAREYF
jgi:hypothetical protein